LVSAQAVELDAIAKGHNSRPAATPTTSRRMTRCLWSADSLALVISARTSRDDQDDAQPEPGARSTVACRGRCRGRPDAPGRVAVAGDGGPLRC
jgi:hypothetical protein